MGLDMYALSATWKPEKPVDFAIGATCQLHYWRKHPDLHGWMERLYREKGGNDAVFNCVPVRLVEADLDRLEADVRADALPLTGGFFFGASDGSEMADDLAFIAEARAAMAAGRTVFYISWW